MKRVGIVVPRCHPTLVGGAEALAWQYATLLADRYEVEVLTSTATDYTTWRNELREGIEHRDGVAIHRFGVQRERSGYFHTLHASLLADASRYPTGAETLRWTEALQEEFIRAQGPQCPGLVAHLATQGDQYAVILFVTYLYSTTYDGVRTLRHRRWAVVPTLHDEPSAHLTVFKWMARCAPRLLWNTHAEQRLGQRIWGRGDGGIVSMWIQTRRLPAAATGDPYLVYCGRIDSHKGCATLISGFEAYKRANASELRLLLTGADKLGVVETADVRYLGFVDESRKFELMAGALAFVHPSPYESLSIVVLEAMAQGTPVIVNGRCEVLADHVEASGGGWVFRDEDGLHAAIDTVRALTPAERDAIGQRAREYVLAHYDREAVRERLFAEIELLAAAPR